jgi:hypothetical protein
MTATANGNGHAPAVHYVSAVPPPPMLTANQAARLEAFLANAFTLRQDILRARQGADPRRSIEAECGYPDAYSVEDYQKLYDREPVAARVVQVWPRETWAISPSVYEDEDSETATEFEEAWDSLGRTLRGEMSRYASEEGSPVWEVLCRADVLSGIGHYGVILLGLDDGLPLEQPVKGIEEKNTAPAGKGQAGPYPGAYQFSVNARATKGRRLLYLRCFPEALASITRFETNPTSPRFGQPTHYAVTLNDPTYSWGGGATPPGASVNVHWTRVIHVADNLESSEVFGVPRMRPVLNPLLDIRKVRGGSAEMYWRGAFPGYNVVTHPQMGAEVELDQASLQDTFEKWMNGLQRYLAIDGASVQSLAPQVVDPTAQITAQIEAVCIELNIPVRIFKGSERGELASSQDERAWRGRVKGRQCGYITPRLICPLVDRLIAAGVLPEPEGYTVWWPDIDTQTDLEKAQVFAANMGAWAQYISGGVEQIIPPMDAMTRERGWTEEEAEAILENAAVAVEESMEADLAQQEHDIEVSKMKIDAGVAPDPQAPKAAPPAGGGNLFAKKAPAANVAAEEESLTVEDCRYTLRTHRRG